MKLTWKTVTLLGLTLFLYSGCLAQDDIKCREANACYCKLSDGSVVNLEPLGLQNGKPKFNATINVTDTANDTILYNPCYSFSYGDDCKDAAACLGEPTPSGRAETFINIAKQENVEWTFTDGNATIIYSYHDQKFDVELECAEHFKPDESTIEVKEITKTTASVKVKSHCACLDGCPRPSPNTEKSGISTGTILVILFFCSIVLYLFVGMIYKKLVYGATGKELIPNVEFWAALPKLVLDGVAFTCNCCRKKSTNTEYDNM